MCSQSQPSLKRVFSLSNEGHDNDSVPTNKRPRVDGHRNNDERSQHNRASSSGAIDLTVSDEESRITPYTSRTHLAPANRSQATKEPKLEHTEQLSKPSSSMERPYTFQSLHSTFPTTHTGTTQRLSRDEVSKKWHSPALHTNAPHIQSARDTTFPESVNPQEARQCDRRHWEMGSHDFTSLYSNQSVTPVSKLRARGPFEEEDSEEDASPVVEPVSAASDDQQDMERYNFKSGRFPTSSQPPAKPFRSILKAQSPKSITRTQQTPGLSNTKQRQVRFISPLKRSASPFFEPQASPSGFEPAIGTVVAPTTTSVVDPGLQSTNAPSTTTRKYTPSHQLHSAPPHHTTIGQTTTPTSLPPYEVDHATQTTKTVSELSTADEASITGKCQDLLTQLQANNKKSAASTANPAVKHGLSLTANTKSAASNPSSSVHSPTSAAPTPLSKVIAAVESPAHPRTTNTPATHRSLTSRPSATTLAVDVSVSISEATRTPVPALPVGATVATQTASSANTTSTSPVTPATNIAAAAEQRQKRIEQQLERNRRNREDEKGAHVLQQIEEDRREAFKALQDARKAEISKPPSEVRSQPTQGPFSLDSLPGIEAVQALRKRNAFSATKPHERKLGRITSADLRLLSLKNNGADWQELISAYEQYTGKARSRDWIRRRIKLVAQVLEGTKATAELIERVLQGVAGAEDTLNDLVEESLQESDSRVGNAPPPGVHRHSSQALRPNTGHVSKIDAAPQSTSSIEPEQTDRPTTGGKKPSWALLQSFWDADVEESDESDVASDASQSSADPEGYNHFEYQVQRRQCTSIQAAAEGMVIDEALWYDVDEPYLSLVKANATASGPVLLMQIGSHPVVDAQKPFSTNHNFNEDGAIQCQYQSDIGVIQTRVVQRTRTHRDRIAVRNKTGWVPRTLYHVKQRITKRAGDGLFDEGTITEIRESFVDECTSADPAWANTKAIDSFVKMTYEIRSANLQLRDIEMTQSRKDLGDELLKQEDGALFFKSKETTNGLLEIWVEKCRLLGPRNL